MSGEHAKATKDGIGATRQATIDPATGKIALWSWTVTQTQLWRGPGDYIAARDHLSNSIL